MSSAVLLVLWLVVVTVECFAEGRRSGGHERYSVASQKLSDNAEASSGVHRCRERKGLGDAAEEKLDLRAELGRPLEFGCGPSQALHPVERSSDSSSVPNFYAHTKESGCNIAMTKKLEEGLPGATLVIKSNNRNGLEAALEPVYTFTYTSEPHQETHLCYTCNSTTPTSPDASLTPTATAAGGAASNCTVHITVPKKTETETAPTTNLPSSTSGTRTTTVPAAVAAGGFLSIMLRM